jgi:hypothetical protein
MTLKCESTLAIWRPGNIVYLPSSLVRGRTRFPTIGGIALLKAESSQPLALVELRGFEPLTSAVRLRRSPN